MPNLAFADRVWMSGLETQSVSTNMEFSGESFATDPSIDTTIKHSGEASLRFNPSAQQMSRYKDHGTVLDQVYYRFYLYITTEPDAANTSIVHIGSDANGSHTIFYLNTDRTLSLFAINAALTDYDIIGSPSSALNTGQWYRIEIFVDTETTTWSWDARIDGSSFASGSYSTGITDDSDFIDFTAFTYNPDTLAEGTVSADFYFDDIGLNDSETTTEQISWLGEGNIVHMFADGDGDTNNCSTDSTGGSGDYTDVDESPTPDDTTSFCELDDNGEILEVNLESSSSAGIDSYDTISVVAMSMRGAENPSGTGSASQAGLIRSASGGTRLQGTRTQTITSGTYVTNATSADSLHEFATTTDPTTGIAWTPTGTNSLDNMQIGVIVPDAAPDLALSALWAIVEYVDGSPPAAGGAVTRESLWDDE